MSATRPEGPETPRSAGLAAEKQEVVGREVGVGGHWHTWTHTDLQYTDTRQHMQTYRHVNTDTQIHASTNTDTQEHTPANTTQTDTLQLTDRHTDTQTLTHWQTQTITIRERQTMTQTGTCRHTHTHTDCNTHWNRQTRRYTQSHTDQGGERQMKGGRNAEGAESVMQAVSASLKPPYAPHPQLSTTKCWERHSDWRCINTFTVNMTPVSRCLRQKASSRRSDEIRAACKTCRAARKTCRPVAWSKVSCDTSTRFPPLGVSGRQKSKRQEAERRQSNPVREREGSSGVVVSVCTAAKLLGLSE